MYRTTKKMALGNWNNDRRYEELHRRNGRQRLSVSVSWGCSNQVPRKWGLKQPRFIVSWFRRPEIQNQNQGIGRDLFFVNQFYEEKLFLESHPTSGGLLAILGVLNLIEMSPQSLPSFSPSVHPVCMSISVSKLPL